MNLNSEPIEAAYPTEPLAVEPDASVREVLELLKTQDTGSVLVCRAGKLAGIFTERDALNLMASGVSLDEPIESLMVANPVTVRSDASVGDAIEMMYQGGYRRLPIVDDQGTPVGVLKVSGIIRYLVEHFRENIYNLPPDPDAVMQSREGA